MNIRKFLAYFCSLSQTLLAQSFLTSIELTITLTLVKQLGIQECIYIGGNDSKSKIIADVKRFSEANIPFTYLYSWQASDYIYYQRFYSKIAIIFKENAMLYIRNITQIFTQYNVNYVMSKFIWLVFIENLQQQSLLAGENFNIPYDCEFIIINELQENYYKVEEIYNIKSNGFGIHFATWNQTLGLKIINEDNFYSRRLDFNGSVLTDVQQEIHKCPLITYTCEANEIILSLVAKMNFRVIPQLVVLKNPLTETITNLYDGDFYTEKQNYNQFGKKIGPLFDDKIHWYIKTPRNVLLPDYYLRPFEASIWMVLSFSILAASIISLIIDYYVGSKNKRNWIDDIFIGIEHICNQCGNDCIQSISLSIVFIALQITVFVLMSAYGAVITSFLAVDKPELPFKDVNEFLENGQYKLGTELGSNGHALLEAHNAGYYKNDVIKKIYNDHTIVFNGDTRAQFLERFCSKNLAVLDFYLDPYESETRCNFFTIPKPLFSFPLSIFLNIRSPFNDAFQIIFLRIYLEAGIKNVNQRYLDEGGFLRTPLILGPSYNKEWIYWYKKNSAFYGNKFRDDTDESDFYPVTISQVYQVFTIPFIGTLLGVIIVFGERVIRQFNTTRVIKSPRSQWAEQVDRSELTKIRFRLLLKRKAVFTMGEHQTVR